MSPPPPCPSAAAFVFGLLVTPFNMEQIASGWQRLGSPAAPLLGGFLHYSQTRLTRCSLLGNEQIAAESPSLLFRRADLRAAEALTTNRITHNLVQIRDVCIPDTFSCAQKTNKSSFHKAIDCETTELLSTRWIQAEVFM